jgi:hypothetical protein
MTLSYGTSVKITSGDLAFVGRTGCIVSEGYEYDRLYRIRLDEPVEVPGVGKVTNDLWERKFFKVVKE